MKAIKNSSDLNEFLLNTLQDVKAGKISHDEVRSLTLVVDKINKNNVNAINYKRLTKHKNQDIKFFEQNQ